ncbi:coiled-coil domain containing 56 [Tachypleus tridentatus]|uniref:coiled-coil domain containing 56 n=1 Tax=Tachypleus tridentatus TaxID=6853 RepID=UPI003FD319D3
MMPKVNIDKDIPESKKAQIDYMRKIEKENLERVRGLQKIRRRNIYTGFFLGGAVLGIYLYSILAVKQEKFLDELDDPQTMKQ